MISLDGKVAVVTGASRGIGKAISLMFSRLGASVVLVSQSGDAKSVSDLINLEGGKSLSIKAQLSNSQDIVNIFEIAIREFTKLDILVNNAGITRDNLILRMSENDWDEVLGINLKAAFLCSKNAMRYMIKKRRGVIINISSIIGIRGNVGQVNYAASKAGLITMTKSFALELASRNIRVNAVSPGFIETDMTRNVDDEKRENLKKKIPLKSFGDVEDVANLVSFLSSDLAKYITGENFIVDGGLSI